MEIRWSVATVRLVKITHTKQSIPWTKAFRLVRRRPVHQADLLRPTAR